MDTTPPQQEPSPNRKNYASVLINWRAKVILCFAVAACLLFGIYLTIGVEWVKFFLSFIISGLVGACFIIHAVETQKPLKKAEQQYLGKIENRNKLSFDEFARKHYPKYDSSIVCKILEQIQLCVAVPMDRLEPTDHLAGDLTLGIWDGFEPLYVLTYINRAYDVKIDECLLSQCSDQLGDFIETIYKEIVKQKNQIGK
jgi:hypothetical protein